MYGVIKLSLAGHGQPYRSLTILEFAQSLWIPNISPYKASFSCLYQALAGRLSSVARERRLAEAQAIEARPLV